MKEDVVGKQFGRWTVLEEVAPVEYTTPQGKIKHLRVMKCQCSCENKTIKDVRLYLLRSGQSQSCGCYKKEQISKIRKLPFNMYIIEDEIVKIYKDNSQEYTIISTEDLERLLSYHIGKDEKSGYWYVSVNGKNTRLHNFLTDGEADHIDQDKSNNTRTNLRKCSHQENMWNFPKPKSNTSGYKGVVETDGKWSVFISINGKTTYFGRYEDKITAAKVYDDKVKELRGEFASPNFYDD